MMSAAGVDGGQGGGDPGAGATSWECPPSSGPHVGTVLMMARRGCGGQIRRFRTDPSTANAPVSPALWGHAGLTESPDQTSKRRFGGKDTGGRRSSPFAPNSTVPSNLLPGWAASVHAVRTRVRYDRRLWQPSIPAAPPKGGWSERSATLKPPVSAATGAPASTSARTTPRRSSTTSILAG